MINKIFENLDFTHSSLPKWADLPEIDLYMDQVISLMEKYLAEDSSTDSKLITPAMINNYVKLGIMPPPIKKKYSREHLAYLLIIGSLKQIMPISNIKIMIDEKLKTQTIAEILDFYSHLYDFTYQTLSETCQHAFPKNEIDFTNTDDVSLFTAIIATNCRNISNKLFFQNHGEKTKNAKKRKEN